MDTPGLSIHTPRLELVSLSMEFMQAAIEKNRPLAERLATFEIPDPWPDWDFVLAIRINQLQINPKLRPWMLRAMVLHSTRRMVGRIGFHDGPGSEHLISRSPLAAEFGYEVFPEFRRQGYAHEASLGMMNWARRVHGVPAFILSISPDNEASQGLARKLGFKKIGSQIDEIDGLEEVLELKFTETE